MRVWAWTLWIQPEGASVQSSGEGRGSPVFAIPSLRAELEPSLTELLDSCQWKAPEELWFFLDVSTNPEPQPQPRYRMGTHWW